MFYVIPDEKPNFLKVCCSISMDGIVYIIRNTHLVSCLVSYYSEKMPQERPFTLTEEEDL